MFTANVTASSRIFCTATGFGLSMAACKDFAKSAANGRPRKSIDFITRSAFAASGCPSTPATGMSLSSDITGQAMAKIHAQVSSRFIGYSNSREEADL